MKVYDACNFKDLRTFVCKSIDSIFGTEQFLDMVDNNSDGLTYKYDFVKSNDEFYIINRETGQYINWYKYTHIGRDVHMNFNPIKLRKFLIDLKKEWDKNDDN